MHASSDLSEFKRLHPASVAVEFVGALQRLIFIIIFYFIFAAQGDGGVSDIVLGVIGLFSILPAVVVYMTYRYKVENGYLIIKSGLLFKQDRRIPVDRIQNINLARGIVHRVLNVVQVQIETASGAGSAEAKMSALSEEEAQMLRKALFAMGAGGGSSDAADSGSLSMAQAGGGQSSGAPAGWGAAVSPGAGRVGQLEHGETIYRSAIVDLMRAGAMENRAGVIVALAAAGIYYVPSLLDDELNGFMSSAAIGGFWVVASLGAAIVIGLLMVGWLLSIGSTVFTYYGFEVISGNGKLKRSYGLVNQVENVVPIRRVQLVRLRETVLHRLFKTVQMHVETAGSYGEGQQAAPTILSPILDRNRIAELGKHVLPNKSFDNPGWIPPSKKLIRQFVQVSILPSLVFGAIGYLFFEERALAIVVGVPLLAGLYAWARYRLMGWYDAGDALVVRDGVFPRTTWMVPVHKVQTVSVRQSPLQNRLGIASIHVTTAAPSGYAVATLIGVPHEKAGELCASLRERARRSAQILGDGL